jgi:decaprenylphospho-beta-D-ribofuranose 2-oxidase
LPQTESKLPTPPNSLTEFVSFDGGVHLKQLLTRPDRYRNLEAIPPHQPRIVRGGGYSYAAASFGRQAVVVDSRAFNRILEMDADAGILECEAGTPLEKIYLVAVPTGWILPVQPGYPKITIGGCITTDAHGKNQFRDGTFRRHVISIRLFHPSHGILELSHDSNREVFELTCGGLGLTGQILSVRLQLQKLSGIHLQFFSHRIRNLEDTPRMMEKVANENELLYTWHNFSISGKSFGRGFLHGAKFLPRVIMKRGNPKFRIRPIDSQTRSRLRFQFLNRFTTRPFNLMYELLQLLSPKQGILNLFDFLFPVSTKVLFFELFGRKGFHEYQIIIPRDAFSEAVGRIHRYIERNNVAICLASCKLFRGEQKFLRFDGDGICLALDFPRDANSYKFASSLDELVQDLRGLPNIIKDSRLPRTVVQACYRDYDLFRDSLLRFDSKRIYRSEISERLGL